MATIEPYETGSGVRYMVRYRTPSGAQTKKRGFVRKRDAVEFMQTVEVVKRAGDYVAPSAGRVTLGERAEMWLRSKHGLAASSVSRTAGIVAKQIVEPHGHVPLLKLTPEWARDWVSDQVDSYAPDTVSKHASTLRQILDQAVSDRVLVRNPLDGIELPTVVETEKRFLTVTEVCRLAEKATTNGPLVWTLATCGLRFGEAAALRYSDLDRNNARLAVNRSVSLVDGKPVLSPYPKGKSRRVVAVPASVLDQLPKGGDPEALLFPDSRGGFMRANNVRRRWWNDAITEAKIYPKPDDEKDAASWSAFTPHELRHTAASLAIQAGANIKAVQNMLGHRSAALTLDRYGHLYPSDVDAVGIAIDSLLR